MGGIGIWQLAIVAVIIILLLSILSSNLSLSTSNALSIIWM